MSGRLPDMQPAPGLCLPPGVEVPHPRPFALRLRAASDETSRTVAHVSNVEYVRWLDRAAELHADAAGYTRAAMAAAGHMWFVARHEVDYESEAFPGDELVAFTWVRSMGRTTSWRNTVVARPDGRVVCSAATRWALVNLATRRPMRIPADMAAALEPLERTGCTSPS